MRGGIIGGTNIPTVASASGVWNIKEFSGAVKGKNWPVKPSLIVEVGSFVKQNTTGDQDIAIATDLTAAAAGSWSIMFWTTSSNVATDIWKANGSISLGYVANGGGSVSQYVASLYGLDNQGVSSVIHRQSAAAIAITDAVGGGLAAEATFVSFPTSTSMRLNWSTNGSGSMQSSAEINYMIISGLTGAKVVSWQLPSGAATSMSVTGVGFKPDLVLNTSAFTSAIPQTAVKYFGVGAFNKHGQQWANSIRWESGAATSVASAWQQVDACLLGVSYPEAAILQWHFNSMDPDGYSVDISTFGGELYSSYGFSLCLAGVSSRIGDFRSAASPQTVNSNHNFVPRGMVFANVNASPSGSAAVAGSHWAWGASDMTNQRSAAFSNVDNVNPTQVDVCNSNTASILGGSNGTTSLAGSVMASIRDLSITWNPGTADRQNLYIVLGDPGYDTLPQTALRPSYSLPIIYTHQHKGVELSVNNRKVIAIMQTGTSGRFMWSDDGLTWTNYDVDIDGWTFGSIGAYVDSGGTERLITLWTQSGTGGGRISGHAYVAVGSFNSDRTILTWGTPVVFKASSAAHAPDFVCHAEGSGGIAHVVSSFSSAVPENYAYYRRVDIDPSGVPSVGSETVLGGSYGVQSATVPSIDIDINTKRLHCTWQTGAAAAGKGIRYNTASYSAGSWTWGGSEVAVDETVYSTSTSAASLKVHFAKDRVYVVGSNLRDAVPNYYIRIWESTDYASFSESESNSVASADRLTYASSEIDNETGNVYIIGAMTTNGVVGPMGIRKWTRATGTLSSHASFGSGVTVSYPAAFKVSKKPTDAVLSIEDSLTTAKRKIAHIHFMGDNSGYQIKYDEIDPSVT